MKRRCLYALLAANLIFASMPVGASSAAPISWQGVTNIATGAGEKGPWEQNNSRYNYVDDPTPLIDARGDVAVAWVDQGRKDVFFQCISPDRRIQFGEAVNVSRSADTFSWLPRLARSPDAPQRLYVLWQEIIFSGGSHGGDMLIARSDDNGASFSEPINISSSVGGDGKGRINAKIWHNGSYDLIAGPNGTVFAAWTEYDGPLWFSRSTDGGKTFERPRRIAGGGKELPARAPSLAFGKDRTIYLAWTNGEDENADIHLTRSADGGVTFDAPQVVAPAKGYADAPKLAASPDGILHLVYAQSSGGPFDQYRIRYTRSANGKTFDSPRDISSPLPDAIESAAFPSLSVDGAGHLYVTFELFPDHRERPRGLGIVVSIDGGNSFSIPTVVPDSSAPDDGTNGSHQGLLMKKLAVNQDGAIAIVNSSLKQGSQSRVWLVRGEMLRGTRQLPKAAKSPDK